VSLRRFASFASSLTGKSTRRFPHEDNFPEPDLANFPGHPLPSIAGQTEEQLAIGMASQFRGLDAIGHMSAKVISAASLSTVPT